MSSLLRFEKTSLPAGRRVLQAAAGWWLPLACVLLLSGAAVSHPSTKPGESDDHHKHAHPPGGQDGATDAKTDASGPTEPEKKQRIAALIKRADERTARRMEIAKDRRQALRRRLVAKLNGQPLTPSMKSELVTHAKRMAQLRRIRYLAASANDYSNIEAVDRLIGTENSRHEGWWRSIRRAAVQAAKGQSSATKKVKSP